MNAKLIGFIVAIALILAGILFNRQDSKELRAEMAALRNEVRGEFNRLRDDMSQFYRTIGQHDAKIEQLEKRA